VKKLRWTFVLAAFGLASIANAQQTLATWERFDYARQRVDSATLSKLSLYDLRRIRGIVFGRHGRVFAEDKDIDGYLRSRPWYKPDAKFTNARLTALERANLDVIRDAESAKHTQIETGDMRFYRTRPITTALLGHHTHGDWEVLAAEVEAIHGKRFDYGEPDDVDAEGNDVYLLQRYFDDRYWYKARESYKAEELSAIERANLDTIQLARMHDVGLSVMPGMMYLFQNTPLTDTMLKGVSLYDLRLLRNEVYARHGRRFQTTWLREFFTHESWYRPRADFTIAELNETEKANVKLIVATEARRHEELSTKKLWNSDLEGLFPEVARRLRNEIFARHGRTFRDPTLQSYFASLEWYHPDPNFDEKSLSEVERANIKLILEHEARAKHGNRFNPG